MDDKILNNIPDDRQDLEKDMIRKELWQDIAKILTPLEFDVIQYIFVEGLSIIETKAALNISIVGGVSTIRDRALKKLKAKLDKDYLEELIR